MFGAFLVLVDDLSLEKCSGFSPIFYMGHPLYLRASGLLLPEDLRGIRFNYLTMYKRRFIALIN